MLLKYLVRFSGFTEHFWRFTTNCVAAFNQTTETHGDLFKKCQKIDNDSQGLLLHYLRLWKA